MTIDPNTLDLVPVANSHVLFVQQGRIVSEAVSGPSGAFVATGLSPQAVYTIITKTPGGSSLYAVSSIAVLSAEKRTASTTKQDLQFARFRSVRKKIAAETELVVTLAPTTDLGVVGLPNQTDRAVTPALPTTTGGGGGGGGGGAAGAGLLGALAVGAGVAAAVSNDDTASPFTP